MAAWRVGSPQRLHAFIQPLPPVGNTLFRDRIVLRPVLMVSTELATFCTLFKRGCYIRVTSGESANASSLNIAFWWIQWTTVASISKQKTNLQKLNLNFWKVAWAPNTGESLAHFVRFGALCRKRPQLVQRVQPFYPNMICTKLNKFRYSSRKVIVHECAFTPGYHTNNYGSFQTMLRSYASLKYLRV